MTYRTRELSPQTWADFERLFVPENEDWAFCACMLYQRGCHLDRRDFPDFESARIQNLTEKRALVDAGRAHGILVYDDIEPIGWCQYGPAEELPLSGADRLDERIPPLGGGVSWRITCFITLIDRRRRGVAAAALRGALESIIARLEMLSWTGRWMLRGHDRNHDPHFCRHEPKVWLWLMEDGCKGGLCEWCHLLEVWAPTIFPDVAELIRIKPDGTPDEEWVPPSELQFDGIGPTE